MNTADSAVGHLLNGVFPLHRKRLTLEWFHSGRAVYEVAGPGADTCAGTWNWLIRMGYLWW